MYREILSELRRWKGRADRKPLILLGARQVGKTWAMRTFGADEYDNVAYVNCDEEPLARQLFDADYNLERIMLGMQAMTGVSIAPEKTLIILDELQEAPRGLHCLKYFCEKAPQYHIIAAGSLLGVTLGDGQAFPVGKVDMLRLYPMNFHEFVRATEGDKMAELLEKGDWECMEIFSDKLKEMLKQYYYVGGMPEIVETFRNTHDLKDVRTKQRAILEAYRNDISKHASTTESMRIGQVMASLPSQIAKENKKFIYGLIKKGARAADYEIAIQWLVDAGIVHRVHRVKELRKPLKFYEDTSAFKLFLLDCGLLGAMAGTSAAQMIIDDSALTEYKGAFTEQYVLQQLVARGYQPYYWSNAKTPAEIDFIIDTDELVIPIEVKAGTNVRSKSMATYISTHPDMHLKGLRLSMLPYKDQGWMENVPLYALFIK